VHKNYQKQQQKQQQQQQQQKRATPFSFQVRDFGALPFSYIISPIFPPRTLVEAISSSC
jgi:hypothetical protein